VEGKTSKSVPRKLLLLTGPTSAGCIGAGKSACLEVLRQLRPQWEILEEPVSTWEQYCPAEGVHVNLLKNW
jgi:hypothetical protein